MKKELIVKKRIKLNADASKVWNALTSSELTKKYMFGSEVVSDWKVGNSIVYKGFPEGKGVIYVKGNILRIEHEKFLQYTVFDPNSELENVPSNYTEVTFELTSENRETTLSVIQGDFSKVDNGEKRFNDANGGWDFALQGLKTLLEDQT